MGNLYAHIVDGRVAEPLVMTPPGVAIGEMFHADLVMVDVTGVTPRPDEGWIATQTGGTWSFTPPPPVVVSVVDQAKALLMGGVTLASTGTPALDGVYRIGAEDRADITAEMLSLMVAGTFTNGGTVLAVGDAAGGVHEFTAAAYREFATGVGGYVGALKQVVLTGEGPLPSGTLAIA